MSGRQEVHRFRTRLDATFKRGQALDGDQVRADFARYLCVLVSGFLETSTVELLLDYSTRLSAPNVGAFVDTALERRTNLNVERLSQLLGAFSSDWSDKFGKFLTLERETAVNSVVANRNQIAHGANQGITLVQIQIYYSRVIEVIDFIADLVDPGN